jgi:hypothetical protein
MKKDTQVLILALVGACIVFSPPTAKSVCAGMFGLFFLLRWLNK